MPRHERIGPTAHYTAYVWHRLGLPHARLFATARGARLFWTLRLGFEWPVLGSNRIPTMERYLEQRHRVLDHLLTEARPDRVVEIAAGLSRRGTTWAADHGVPYLELDLPHMVEAKRALLERRATPELRARLAGLHRVEPADVLAEDFPERLRRELDGAERPVVIAEGLLGYFEAAERRRLIGSIRAALAAAGGGTFLCDLHLASEQRRMGAAALVVRRLIDTLTRGQGVRAPLADGDAADALFRELGFTRVERFVPVEMRDVLPMLSPLRSPAVLCRASG